MPFEIPFLKEFKCGKIENDLSKPDGMEQKLLDSTRINKLGWSAKISLEEGLKLVYLDYKNSV